jgi:uncharacterized protein YndB with AHSA1/START domain
MTKQIEKTVLINTLAPTVWEYLTNPNLMKKWMGESEMNIEIITDWKVGNSIIIKGFHHLEFENKGIVLQFEPNKVLQYNQLSSISRLIDKTENYSVISFNLTSNQRQTWLALRVHNFPTETIFKHLDFYWKTTMEIIKRKIEEIEVLE